MFAGTVQTNRYDKINDHSQIGELCDKMMATHLGSPLQRLAHVVSEEDKCLDASYNNSVKEYNEVSWDSSAATSVSELR